HVALPIYVKGDGFFANKSGYRFKQALNDAWAFLYPMLPYLFIGVSIGAFIYGFIPEAFITKYASADGIIAVVIASVIGIPMYISPRSEERRVGRGWRWRPTAE